MLRYPNDVGDFGMRAISDEFFVGALSDGGDNFHGRTFLGAVSECVGYVYYCLLTFSVQ